VPLDPTQSSAHVSNIGRLVEDMEMKMRSLLEAVYGSKTKGAPNERLLPMAYRPPRPQTSSTTCARCRVRQRGEDGWRFRANS
jgi:hypothetical protein